MYRETYPIVAIQGLLYNWGEVAVAEDLRIVDMRCDIEMALTLLPSSYQKIVRTLFVAGEDAVTCAALNPLEVALVLRDLHTILNERGLSDYGTGNRVAPGGTATAARYRPGRPYWRG